MSSKDKCHLKVIEGGASDSVEVTPVTEPLPTNDQLDIARRFADRYGATLRYVTKWGCWMWWNGSVWKKDETQYGFHLVAELCGGQVAKNESERRSLKSRATIAAVEALARADRRLAATSDQWDTKRFSLNTPGGVISLQTGNIRQHKPDYFMTKITQYAPEGKCPGWLKFLQEVTAGNEELISFLQRVCGYALTGSVREDALFFLWGTGANGKSVFVSITHILNDYAQAAPMELFVAAKNEQHPTGIARMRGARLVAASETEKGRNWSEAKIKHLTGGEQITARFMHQDFFEFLPQFKLLISGNHRPVISNVDEAIKRRMNLIPFGVTIPEEQRDPYLRTKLADEGGGILQWMIDGCLDWRQRGLDPPEVVRTATDEYLEAEDLIKQFINARQKAATFKVRSSALYQDWKDWCEARGEDAGSYKAFSQGIREHGYRIEITAKGSLFKGLK